MLRFVRNDRHEWCGVRSKNMGPGLRERLQAGEVLIADGATGTLLQQRGLGRDDGTELWNVEHPDIVGSVAADYAAAGSDLVYTNTFGGNRLKLN